MNENIETKFEGAAPGAFQRIVNVARLHLVNKSSLFKLPLFILVMLLLLNLALAWTIMQLRPILEAEASEDYTYWSGGGSGFIITYMLVVAVQSINMTFPFAQAYSVTRRDFFLGSILAYIFLSLFYAVVMTAFAWLEGVTGGWGINAYVFGIDYLGVTGVAEQFFVFFMGLLFFFFIGSAAAALYVRFRAWGLVSFFVGLTIITLAIVLIPIFTRTMDQVGAWFVATGTIGISAWLLVPTVIAAIAGMLILRRATPVS